MPDLNHLNQPIGESVGDWQAPPAPERRTLSGQYCRLEPLEAHHADDLYAANAVDADGKDWTYLPYGPFASIDEYRTWIERNEDSADPRFFAIVDLASNQPVGVASYLRIKPELGSIEVGHIKYSPLLQRTRAATEAMYLMMAHAFALGYRRYEWKCDALNAPSRAAAERLGLTFEGVFRHSPVVKGRKGEFVDMIELLRSDGYARALIDGESLSWGFCPACWCS